MAFPDSALLQALGWATLNSFWQMALLWCLYLAISNIVKPSSNQKYLVAVYSVFTGAAWSLYSFAAYLNDGQSRIEAINLASFNGLELLPVVLTSASIAYLVLLIVPAYRVFRNWRFLQTIKSQGLQKAPIKHRLFAQKISIIIGIKRQVQVHLSTLVTSPVTIGYIKPLILVPVAALSNLSPSQLEAILLHELSHIKRHDYLVNLLLTAVHVLLYFNPFVKLFIKAIEAERENCCDELVLQFEYDKVSYASALLQLEKTNHHSTNLAMAATNTNNLLSRIEKIVGVKRKRKLNASHLLGAIGALLLLLTINSMIIAAKSKTISKEAMSYFSEPYAYFTSPNRGDILEQDSKENPVHKTRKNIASTKSAVDLIHTNSTYIQASPETASEIIDNPDFHTVAFDKIDASLTAEQKANVKSTLANTKKVLQSNWSEVERSIPDGILPCEEAAIRNEYLNNIESINWQRMEQSMKAGYDRINWEKATAELNQQMALAKLDSIRTCYEVALSQIEKAKAGIKVEILPLPDASVKELKKANAELKKTLTEIKGIRSGKVIKL